MRRVANVVHRHAHMWDGAVAPLTIEQVPLVVEQVPLELDQVPQAIERTQAQPAIAPSEFEVGGGINLDLSLSLGPSTLQIPQTPPPLLRDPTRAAEAQLIDVDQTGASTSRAPGLDLLFDAAHCVEREEEPPNKRLKIDDHHSNRCTLETSSSSVTLFGDRHDWRSP